MKIISFFLILCLFSCADFCWVEPSFQEEAKRMYNSIGTYRVYLSEEEGKKLFGKCYRKIDKVFVFQNMYRKKYILVRNGEPYTYADEEIFFGF